MNPYKHGTVRWFLQGVFQYFANVIGGIINFLLSLLTFNYWKILVRLDKMFNSFIGGDPNETMSSRFGREGSRCYPCYLICRMLNWFQHDHCKKALEPAKDHKNEVWK